MTTHDNDLKPDDWSPAAALNAAQSIDATDADAEIIALLTKLLREVNPRMHALEERVAALDSRIDFGQCRIYEACQQEIARHRR